MVLTSSLGETVIVTINRECALLDKFLIYEATTCFHVIIEWLTCWQSMCFAVKTKNGEKIEK